MVVITRGDYEGISRLVNTWQIGKELECVFKLPLQYNRDLFRKCVASLLSYGVAKDEVETLSIGINNHRITVKGLSNICTLCKTNKFDEIMSDVTVINKTLVDKVVDMKKYGIRFRLSDEIDKQMSATDLNSLVEEKVAKTVRLKKRISITVDKSHRFDLTLVKMMYVDPQESLDLNKLQRSKESYEMELEFIGKKRPNIEKMMDWVTEGLKVINDQEYLMTDEEQNQVVDSYLGLVVNHLAIDKKKVQDFKERNPRKLFVGPQPVTLERQHLLDTNKINILSEYTVTDKADGERALVFIDDMHNVYLVNNRLKVKKTDLVFNKHSNSLLDAEVITKVDGSKQIACFDIYFLDGDNVSNLAFHNRTQNERARYNLLQDLVQDKHYQANDMYTMNVKVFHKAVRGLEDIFDVSKIMLNRIKTSLDYKTDGIIYTPSFYPVGGSKAGDNFVLGGTWKHVLKWKEPDDNTIDFMVRKDVDESGKDVFMVQDGHLMRRYSLYVGTNIAKAEDYFKNVYGKKRKGEKPSRYIAKKFAPPGSDRFDLGTFYGVIENENSNPKTKNKEEITDMCIVEMAYIKSNWVAQRIRYDKTEEMMITKSVTANNYENAASVWRSIQYPVEADHITGKSTITPDMVPDQDAKYYEREVERNKSTAYAMLVFHNNWVKNKLIGSFNEMESLFDIACGKGGDLMKWKNAKFKTVIGVDYNEDNITNYADGAYKRLSEDIYDMPSNYRYAFIPNIDCSKVIDRSSLENIRDPFSKRLAKIIWGYETASDYLVNFQNIVASRFDVVSCQFACHYFFKDKDSLSGFVQNIDKHLKVGGYFVGTCFDGTLVNDLFDGKKKNESILMTKNDTVIWRLTKKYDEYEPKTLGQKINVYIESIGKPEDEFLVDLDLLKEKLEEYGIVMLDEQECDKLSLAYPSIGTFKDMFSELKKEMKQNNRSNNNPKYKEAVAMTEAEKILSFLNTWFVFKKTRQVKKPQQDPPVAPKIKAKAKAEAEEKEIATNLPDKLFFYSKSKAVAAGDGVREHVNNKEDYIELNKLNKDWRKVLSNFHECPFTYEGKQYKSIEHAFQSAKIRLSDPKKADYFTMDSGHEIGKGDGALARKNNRIVSLSGKTLSEWERTKLMIMYDISKAKYEQCEEAMVILQATRNAELWHIQSRAQEAERFTWLEALRSGVKPPDPLPEEEEEEPKPRKSGVAKPKRSTQTKQVKTPEEDEKDFEVETEIPEQFATKRTKKQKPRNLYE